MCSVYLLHHFVLHVCMWVMYCSFDIYLKLTILLHVLAFMFAISVRLNSFKSIVCLCRVRCVLK